MSKTKTTTTTREYDAKGKLLKETVIETEYETQGNYYWPTWVSPHVYPYTVRYDTVTSTVDNGDRFTLINGSAA